MAVIKKKKIKFPLNKTQILHDYKIAELSREISYMSRREVLTGKAKFGILGDGKELPQIVLAHFFKDGDFRSGYYRDQTLMLALDNVTVSELFAQLYADPDPANEPHSAGRQMNAHFATHSLDENGEWNDLLKIKNTSSDVSCTSGQMARAVGLALASKKYREIEALHAENKFSDKGNEVVYVTIGDASTSEGPFWESVNAIGVMGVPMVISVWDDGYGISVPIEYQTTKSSISSVLAGFQIEKGTNGIEIIIAKAWDYEGLYAAYAKAEKIAREKHIPCLVHVQEVTQPQGHSTSGSHERYKSKDRLQWEKDTDCILSLRKWIIANKIATEATLDEIRDGAIKEAKDGKNKAWKDFSNVIKAEINEVKQLYANIANEINDSGIESIQKELASLLDPLRRDLMENVQKALVQLYAHNAHPSTKALSDWNTRFIQKGINTYKSNLYSESSKAAINIESVAPSYSDDSPLINGSQVLNAAFDNILERDPRVVAFGEDVGQIGDVNQGFAGMQEKYGVDRVFDTGIREHTIMGQAIGMAMRGLRPIAEIQYLDYFIWGLQPISDDLATIRWRSGGRQQAPCIIRTRGHRLEGIWHSGSPMGMLINSVRGVYLLVPRNMTQAAGFYNTMLASDDPAIIVECLNGYRLKERLPDNIGEFRVPIGIPEVIREGSDVTVVTYGSVIREAMKAAKQLEQIGVSVEIIDVQTLLPFDVKHQIVESIKKTNRVVFLDEDVPGGGTAYMMQKVLEEQGAYYYLDSKPKCIAALENRPAYGSDGDYFCKPVVADIFKGIYEMMNEFDPQTYPDFF